MPKILTTIGITAIGLVLTQYQLFHHTNILSMVAETPTYIKINEGLNTLNDQLQKMSNKLLRVEPRIASGTVEAPIEIEELAPTSISTDRTVLNAENILYYTNQERTKRGLRPLKFNSKLTRSAEQKNKDMFTNQYFSHISPKDSNKNFAYFIGNQSYDYARVSENLAMGDFTTAKDVVTAWMNSPDHRANILYADYQHIGASVKTGTMNGLTEVMIVQHFGIPRNACPTVSDTILTTLQSVEKDAGTSKKTAEDLEKTINRDATLGTAEVENLINVYNESIRTYNELVARFKNLSTEYNVQVKKYDDCIKKLK